MHNCVGALFQIDAFGNSSTACLLKHIKRVFFCSYFVSVGTLAGLLSEISEAEEDIREKTLKLLALKLKNIQPEYFTKEVREYLIQECKKILQVDKSIIPPHNI